MKSVLVATDGSDEGGRALEAAAELAKRYGMELVIVNVEQGYLSSGIESPPGPGNAGVYDVLYAASAEILAEAEDKAKSLGIANIRSHSGLGDPAGFILEIASQENPEFIVVGKRGKGRLAALLIGSVSQKLVSLAQCKVLVVP